jgi:hypothetical protein
LGHTPGSSNEERDLHRWAKDAFGIQIEPFYLKLKMLRYGTAVPEEVQFPVLLPHELLYTVVQQGSLAQKLSLFAAPGPEGAKLFWEHLGEHGEAAGAPCVPLNFHIDGIEIYRNTEFIAYSFSSVLAVQSGPVDVLDEKLLLCLLPYSCVPGRLQKRAHGALAHLISWSLKAAHSGLFPTCGPNGEALEGWRATMSGAQLGVRARLFGWKGDLKAGWEVHNFSEKYSCRYLCPRCRAVKPLRGNTALQNQFVYKDFSERALSGAPVLTERILSAEINFDALLLLHNFLEAG